jgi:hypothetical protein
MLPENLLDIDSAKIQQIIQGQAQYLPDDNSVMTSEEYEIGGSKKKKTIVYKDDVTFGFN